MIKGSVREVFHAKMAPLKVSSNQVDNNKILIFIIMKHFLFLIVGFLKIDFCISNFPRSQESLEITTTVPLKFHDFMVNLRDFTCINLSRFYLHQPFVILPALTFRDFTCINLSWFYLHKPFMILPVSTIRDFTCINLSWFYLHEPFVILPA